MFPLLAAVSPCCSVYQFSQSEKDRKYEKFEKKSERKMSSSDGTKKAMRGRGRAVRLRTAGEARVTELFDF